MMRRVAIAGLAAAMLLAPGAMSARTVHRAATSKPTAKPSPSPVSLDDMKALVKAEADRRLGLLTGELNRFQQPSHLQTATVQSAGAQLQTEITALNNYETQLDAATDAAGIQKISTDLKNEYPAFKFVNAKAAVLLATDSTVTTGAGLVVSLNQASDKADQAALEHKDLSNVQDTAKDMTAHLTKANDAYLAVEAAVSGLKPADGLAVLTAQQAKLVAARADLGAAATDLDTINQALDQL